MLFYRLSATTIASIICLANRIDKSQLRKAVIDHLIRAGKSSPIFRRYVNLLNEKLLRALFRRSELSDEEKVHLLICWFNAGTKRQPRGIQYALEQAVCRLITGIDCSTFDATFVASIYSQRGSAFAESAACK